jgi:molecular chaperone HtpG
MFLYHVPNVPGTWLLRLGLNIDEDAAAEDDADMPTLDEGAAEERKMEEVD